MNVKTLSTIMIASLAAVFALSGCSSSTEVKSSATLTTSTEGFVSPGKGQAPVTMSYYLTEKPQVGAPISMELVFNNDRNEPMQLEISADDALAVNRQSGRSIRPGESVVVELLPQAEGRYYVNVIARLGALNQGQARVFSVPVQVGAGGIVKTAEKASVGPDGERLIRMRAQEKVPD